MWLLILITLLCSCASTRMPAAPPIWNAMSPGLHRVGFHSEMLRAPSPLQVSVWYPATSGGDPLTWRELFFLSLSEKSGTAPSTEERDQKLLEYKEMIVSDGVTAAAVDQLFELRFLARRDARSLRQRYPLVLIAQGNGQSAVHQALLAEFLASHGFVVATVPSITRLNGPPASDTELMSRVEAEAANLERALTFTAARDDVDSSRLAVIGYSFGARSALVLAMRRPIRALVSLDGGIGTARAVGEMPSPQVALPPVLHLYETGDERMKPDLTYLRSLPAPHLRIEKMESLKHTHFSSIGYAAALIPSIATATHAGPELQREVRFVSETTLEFLQEQMGESESLR